MSVHPLTALLLAGATAATAPALPPVLERDREQSPVGRVVWHALETDRPERAADFYQAVFGWQLRSHGGTRQRAPRTTLDADGTPVASVERRAGVARWTVWIGVESVDLTVRQAEALGARLVDAPSDERGRGRRATLLDRDGAEFTVFAAPRARPEVPGGPFVWDVLLSRDRAANAALYAQLFGWESLDAAVLTDFDYRVFVRGGRRLAGIVPADEPRWPGTPPHWVPVVEVENLGATLARVAANGGRHRTEPLGFLDVGRVSWVIDPQGAELILLARAAPTAHP